MAKMLTLNKIEGVVFDFGDVLYDASEWRRWLAQEMRASGVEISHAQLCAEWEDRLSAVYSGKREYWHTLREYITSKMTGAENAERLWCSAKDAAQIFERRMNAFPEAAPMLKALRERGLKLAILTDSQSASSEVEKRLAHFGLAGLLDAVISSADIGAAKPSLVAYEAAMSTIDAASKETIFVGHDEDELLGAIAAGMIAVAVNNTTLVPAHFHLSSLSDLPCLFGEAGSLKFRDCRAFHDSCNPASVAN